jgi:hypothetical protein
MAIHFDQHFQELKKNGHSLLIYYLFIYLFIRSGFELKTLHLLGRHSTTWALLPAICAFSIF